MRNKSLVLVPLLVLLCVSVVSVSAQTLCIYHIDVDQADATLFVAPNGKTLLVDSGKNNHGSRIKAVMGQAGVSQIDFFVATHYHEDHYGGIDDLVNDPSIMKMSLNNSGDKITLIDAGNLARDSFQYTSSLEGAVIPTGH